MFSTVVTGQISDARPNDPYKDGAHRLYVAIPDEQVKTLPLIPEHKVEVPVTLKMPSGRLYHSQLLFTHVSTCNIPEIYRISTTPKDVEYLLEKRMVDILLAEGFEEGQQLPIRVKKAAMADRLLLEFFHPVSWSFLGK